MPKPLIIFSTHRKNIPPSLLPYLMATGSLTAKFEKLSGQKLVVKPISEGRQTLTLAEKKQLNLPLNRPQSAWVREVYLKGWATGEAWVLARSVFPFASLAGNAKQLANLGATPIGYVMFGRNGATIVKRWIQKTQQGWQRTSLYDWQGRKLLISETFLPEFLTQL